MKCETTSSVEECALRARSTHGVHHAIVEVNIVVGVVLGEVLVARVVPLVVDAVVGLTLGLIAHVVIVVFVVAILQRFFLYGRYTLYTRDVIFWMQSFILCPLRKIGSARAAFVKFTRLTNTNTTRNTLDTPNQTHTNKHHHHHMTQHLTAHGHFRQKTEQQRLPSLDPTQSDRTGEERKNTVHNFGFV